MMQNYFHTGIADRLLFYGWTPKTVGEFIASWFAILLCGVLHEFLRYYRLRLTSQYQTQCFNSSCTCPFKLCCNPSHKIATITSNLPYEGLPSPSKLTPNSDPEQEEFNHLTSVGTSDATSQLTAQNIGFKTNQKVQQLNNDASPAICGGYGLPLWSYNFILVTLFALHTTLSFMLMLIFMTFNIWLCVATVLGMSIGYYVFFLGFMFNSTSLNRSQRDILVGTNEITQNDLIMGQPCC